MDTNPSLFHLKIRTAQDRCSALTTAVEALQLRVKTSRGAGHVLLAVRTAIQAVRQYLSTQQALPDQDLLTDAEKEARIQRVAAIIPYLHNVLSFLEHSDVSSVPAELAALLRRELRALFQNAELIVVSSLDLNYSIIEIAQYIRPLFKTTEVPEAAVLPAKIFRASIPAVESEQALLHCMLAHEMGHPLYLEHEIEATILPVPIDSPRVEAVIDSLKKNKHKTLPGQGEQEGGQAFDELSTRRVLTATVNDIVLNWLEELAADLYGIHLFGPAYLIGFIHFIVGFHRLDDGSQTHPSPRLRLKLLFRELDTQYMGGFSPSTETFLVEWRAIGLAPGGPLPVLQELAHGSIDKDAVLDRIRSAVAKSLTDGQKYSQQRYTEDTTELGPLIDANIPPAEYLKLMETRKVPQSLASAIQMSGPSPDCEPGHLTTKVQIPTSTVAILNAGWERYLSGLAKYEVGVPPGARRTSFDLYMSYNRFLLKAMELNHAIWEWNEARQ